MGQDKQQLAKLLSFVKAVYDNPENKEFSRGIQSLILQDIKVGKSQWSDKIDEIYEYCLCKNLRNQAEDFYRDLPKVLMNEKAKLIEDYISMEEARRKDNFDEFGLHLYQQLEAIVNTLANDEKLSEVVAKMMDQPAKISTYEMVKVDGKFTRQYFPALSVSKRYGVPIAELLYGKSTENEKKKSILLSEQKAMDKLVTIVYFIRFQAKLTDAYYQSQWKDDINTFWLIYAVRNHVHRGASMSIKQKDNYEIAIDNKSQSYLKFLSTLVSFVEGIEKAMNDNNGSLLSQELIEYAASL